MNWIFYFCLMALSCRAELIKVHVDAQINEYGEVEECANNVRGNYSGRVL